MKIKLFCVSEQSKSVFKARSVLKTYFNEGKLPSVTQDIYGLPLKPGEATIEHNIPKSKGGRNQLCNYSLANREANMIRSNRPLLLYTTIENIKKFYEQFKNVVLPNFNGNEFIEASKKNLNKIGIKF